MKSIDRITALVELLMSSESDLGIREIAERSSMPKSSVQRILSSLKEKNWVVQDPESGNYRIALRLLVLAGAWRFRLELARQSRGVLEDLCRESRQTVLLLVHEGSCGICLDKVEPERSLKLVAEVGKTFPLNAAACGKILLAYSSRELREKLLESPFRAFTPATITGAEIMKKEIEDIRARGYAVSRGEMTTGAAEIAIPLLDGDGNLLAALSVAGPCFEMEGHFEEYEGMLRRAAARILGAPAARGRRAST